MKLHSHMTIFRNEETLRVSISGTYCGEDEAGPAKIIDIFAEDYDGEVALTEKEWVEAEEALMDEWKEFGSP